MIVPKVGIHIPGGIMAGTFWRGKGKSFYYVGDFSKCVTLKLQDHEYPQVVVQVDDKFETAKRLIEALK